MGRRHFWKLAASALLTLILLSAAATGWAQPSSFPTNRITQNYFTARAAYKSNPDNPETACTFAKACFDRAESAPTDSERSSVASEGIAAARSVLARGQNAAAHYYLALNLGQLARTKKMSGLKIVREMEGQFDAARRIDEKIDYAGPDRGLGLLYLDAPGWPVSVGSRSKARQHLSRSVQLCPDYPDNRLSLLEACVQWKDWQAAQKQSEELRKIWDQAKTKYSGQQWHTAWKDWQDRWSAAQSRMQHAD